MRPNLDRLVNATGIVVHTNLGRSLLSTAAAEHVVRVATGYSNLEFDVAEGKRGLRYASVEALICELTGAEAALAVNNNAGAVLLALNSLAKDRQVIVSRGELVEIGGSFRIPDVMSKSGGILTEVGTTNRTHLKDYEAAINDETGLLLKVHTSNYGIVGFTADVSLADMVALGQRRSLPVMYDLGSGTLIDFREYGLPHEPTVSETVAAGADVVTFSGDKLLGGPQAGIMVGKKDVIDQLKNNPLTRALRIDKMTLAALEMTLRAYRDKKSAVQTLPTLNMITAPIETVAARAEKLAAQIRAIDAEANITADITETFSRPGGGSLPFLELPTRAVTITIVGLSANALELQMRRRRPPIIGRIENNTFLMDMRTVADSEISDIKEAIIDIAKPWR